MILPNSGSDILKEICAKRNWDIREPQLLMVHGIISAMKKEAEHKDCIVSAPVGTGKTLGYLCAALPYGKIAISTSTKALQEQIIKEELPEFANDIMELYGHKISYYLIKGKDNYLCLKLAYKWLSENSNSLFTNDKGENVYEKVEEIIRKGEDLLEQDDVKTHDMEADLNSLPVEVRTEISWANPEASHAVKYKKDETEKKDLFYKARKKSKESDIVVTNTALLASNIWGSSVLMDSSVFYGRTLIVDEAHHAHNIILSSGSIISPEKDAEYSGVPGIRPLVNEFREAVKTFSEMENKRRKIIQEPLIKIREELENSRTNNDSAKNTKIDKALKKINDFNRALKDTKSVNGKEIPTYHIEATPDGTVSAMIIFTDNFRYRLHEVLSGDNEYSRTIFCSGTITVEDIKGIGIRDAGYVSVGSPFNYRRCRMFLPKDKKFVPNDYSWVKTVKETLFEMVDASDGRTLILTTSRDKINVYADALKGMGLTIITQNDNMSRKEILTLFSEDEKSVMIGTKSYWEGIDIPGNSLQQVIIDKIMFPIVNDPVYVAMAKGVEAKGGNAFNNIMVTQARQMMTQGFGRLIRSVNDKGGIAILDSRLQTKKYGKSILSMIDDNILVTNNLSDYCDWMMDVVEWDGEGRIPHDKGVWSPIKMVRR